MTELWTPPSDDMLLTDGIAQAKIEYPYDPPDLEAVGVLLPEIVEEQAIEAAAAVALAEIDDSEPDGDSGEAADDDVVEDSDDVPIGADV